MGPGFESLKVHQPKGNKQERIKPFFIVSVANAQGPPVPIPNTVVKLCSAENTCLETDRENRSTLTLLIGVANAQGPPVPIPNTVVKLCSAENTCLETDREDRSTPIFLLSSVGRALGC